MSRLLVVAVAVAISLSACTSDGDREFRGTAGNASENSARASATAPSQDDFADSSDLEVPERPKAAAAFLAREATSETSPAAVWEMLTRSGIPIFEADTGELANQPQDPTYVDSYLYDVTVPLLATSLGDGPSVSFETVGRTLTTLGLRIRGRPVTSRDVATLVEAWTRTAAKNESSPSAFAGLMFGALEAAYPEPRGIAPDDRTLDQVRLLLFLSSLVSDTGELVGLELEAYGGGTQATGAGAASATECEEIAKEYDSGLEKKAIKDTAKEVLKKAFGKDAATWSSRAYDAASILGTLEARMAFLAGLRLTIKNSAPEDGVHPHLRHSVGDVDGNHWTYLARAEFKSNVLLPILSCGPLAGLKIPEDGPVKNLRLQWELAGGLTQCLESAGASNCDKLKRISSGGGGDFTNIDGESELKVETQIEPGCPNGAPGSHDKARCKKGPIREGKALASVTVDLTRDPPLKLTDLIYYKLSSPDVSAGLTEMVVKALAKILVDIGTDAVTNARAARSTVTVYYHQLADYRLDESYNGVVFSATKCAGPEGQWTVKVSGNLGASVPAKASGEFRFELDKDLEGRWAGSIRIVVSYKGFVSTSTAGVTARVRLVEDSPTSAHLVVTDARVSGDAAYTGAGISLRRMLGGDGGSASIPLKLGSYCKGNS